MLRLGLGLSHSWDSNSKPIRIQIVEASSVFDLFRVNALMDTGIILMFGAFLHGIHKVEVEPRGVEGREREGVSALDLSAVTLPELLHLVAALDGGFGRGGVGASGGDGVGDLLPVGGLEVAAAKGVPPEAVGMDEGEGLVGGPAGRRNAAEGDSGGWI
ncbi:hypothetical protein Lal_00006614 [Lupinus albus]|nr:hypothetical protein Lal_00006614 [Lupinus albus]